jgi:hypothetical protein
MVEVRKNRLAVAAAIGELDIKAPNVKRAATLTPEIFLSKAPPALSS